MNVIQPIRPRGALGSVGRRVKRSAAIFFIVEGILVGSLAAYPITASANSESVAVYDDEIPINIRQYCELVGTEFNICPELLEAMAFRESRFKPDAKNGIHVGLMQINVKVHADRIASYGWTAEDMTDAYKNLMVAGDYLAELYEKYGDDNPIVLGYYSGNTKSVAKYKEYGFLCPYVEDVLTKSANYERLHGK